MTINANDLQDMVRHWLNTPVNGYLGSGYGADTSALLQSPHSSGVADAFLAKLRADIPIIGSLPTDMVNLYASPVGADRLEISIGVAGTFVQVSAGAQ